MINPKELRIGSWVMHEDKFIVVDSITDKGINLYVTEKDRNVTFSVFKFEDLEPIPLTPEILERCGFEKDKNLWFTKKYLTEIKVQREEIQIELNIKSGRCGLMDMDLIPHPLAMTAKAVIYLHQLQNLYFALTGEELEIKQLEHAEK